jgi:hypothetical protein
MKNIDKSILFTTDTKCFVCNKGVILERFTLHVVSRGSNGIIGPGSRSWQGTEIITSYHCENCGIKFEPTIMNKLTKNSERNFKIADAKLKVTKLIALKRNLSEGEVFRLDPGNNHNMVKEDTLLTKAFLENASLYLYLPTKDYPDGFEDHRPEPYIVKIGNTFNIVYWSKMSYTSKYLSKKEKQRIKTEYNTYQKKRASNAGLQKNYMLELEFAGLNTTTHPVEVKSKPLPIGSVKAVKVFLSQPLGDFYIPANAIVDHQ